MEFVSADVPTVVRTGLAGELLFSMDRESIIGLRVFTSPKPPASNVTEEPTHRHKKRGTEYVLIGIGKMQAEHWYQSETPSAPEAEVDMREVAIYRSAIDPSEIWVRPREEFEDGRFEALRAALSNQANGGRN